MQISDQLKTIRSNTSYIEGSVHFNKRAYDKKFEVVARLKDHALNEMDLCIGGEVVLDIQDKREDALAVVRFFRGHQQ